MFGSTDRSKGTSSTLSLNEQQKKSSTNGSQRSGKSFTFKINKGVI